MGGAAASEGEFRYHYLADVFSCLQLPKLPV